MRRSRLKVPTRLFPFLLTGLILALVAPTVSLSGQTAETRTGHGFGLVYDAAHEVTIAGNIQEVVTRHEAGSPAGWHLLVAAPQGVVDAHLGPFLNSEVKEALHAGTPVQIIGATAELHGRQYLLARELTVGGKTVTIRGKNGFMAIAEGSGSKRAQAEKTSQVQVNGGAQ